MSFLKSTWTFLNTSLLPRMTSLAGRRLAIAAISVFDVILLFVFADGIVLSEENPIGLALIKTNGGDVTRFALVKLACTTLVFIVLRELERRDFLTATVVTNALLAFQSWLIWYLCVSTYWTTRFEMIGMGVLSVLVFFVPLYRTLPAAIKTRKPLLRRA